MSSYLLFPLLLFMLSGAVSVGYPEEPTPENHVSEDILLRKIAPGVWIHTTCYTFPGDFRFPSNGLVIQDNDSLILIDTGWGEIITSRLLEKIERDIGYPVRQAIITHSHYDRIAGADLLESRGIKTWVHPTTQRLAMQQGIPVPDDTLGGLHKPGSFRSMRSVEVFYPGHAHAPENIMVWLPEKQILFGGCPVREIASNSLGNTADANLVSWQEAIRLTLSRYPKAKIVVPGHGEPGGIELLQHTLRLFEN